MASSGPTIPAWIFQLKPLTAVVNALRSTGSLVARYGGPGRAILAIVLGYLAETVYGLGTDAINYTLGLFDQIATVTAAAFRQAFLIEIAKTGALFRPFIAVHESLVAAALSTGPAAPFVVIAVYAAEIIVGLWLADTIIRVTFGTAEAIPVLGVVFSVAGSLYDQTLDLLGRAREVFT